MSWGLGYFHMFWQRENKTVQCDSIENLFYRNFLKNFIKKFYRIGN